MINDNLTMTLFSFYKEKSFIVAFNERYNIHVLVFIEKNVQNLNNENRTMDLRHAWYAAKILVKTEWVNKMSAGFGVE